MIAVNIDRDLASDERKARVQFEHEPLNIGQQGLLQISFLGIPCDVQELKVVGIVGDLLNELTLALGQSVGEVVERLALTLMARGADTRA